MKIFVVWALLTTNGIQNKFCDGQEPCPTGVNNG